MVSAWPSFLSIFYVRISMPKCSNILEFHLFADDTNLFLNNRNILNSEITLNVELKKCKPVVIC